MFRGSKGSTYQPEDYFMLITKSKKKRKKKNTEDKYDSELKIETL